jgi:HD domain
MTLIGVLSIIQSHSDAISSCTHQIQPSSRRLYSWPCSSSQRISIPDNVAKTWKPLLTSIILSKLPRSLSRIGGITDLPTLQAAILHDTIEDTETSPQELEDYFGQEVRLLVQEVTDDKSLPKQERKRLQVEHAPNLSTSAKLIKIGDKICNVSEITPTQPAEWPLQRKLEYLDWTEKVVLGCRDCNLDLEQHFDAVLKKSRASLV